MVMDNCYIQCVQWTPVITWPERSVITEQRYNGIHFFFFLLLVGPEIMRVISGTALYPGPGSVTT